MTNLPIYTGLTVVAMLLLHLVLSFRVSAQRGKHEVDLGDGGVESLLLAIRAQGNFIENAPIFLIGLGLCEVLAGSNLVVASLAGLFVVSRLMHAIGLSRAPGPTKGRFIGALGTLLVTLATTGYLAWLCFLAW